jgi:hypothetical protein
MNDLGELMGSLMSGLIRARRVADEQTAALAEYYKDNPLLEGLSVPRIRIPELTLDIPLLIEDHTTGKGGKMQEISVIAKALDTHLKDTIAAQGIKLSPAFVKMFADEVSRQLAQVSKSGSPIMKESVARGVQKAFTAALIKSKSTLTAEEKQVLAGELRAKATDVALASEPISPIISANIKTADVKERASSATVVRLKITLREEGLEWSTQASDAGGVVRNLQPE